VMLRLFDGFQPGLVVLSGMLLGMVSCFGHSCSSRIASQPDVSEETVLRYLKRIFLILSSFLFVLFFFFFM